jgi:hypothetical protein
MADRLRKIARQIVNRLSLIGASRENGNRANASNIFDLCKRLAKRKADRKMGAEK